LFQNEGSLLSQGSVATH